MIQKLNVELSIEIPKEYVLITKLEYEELKSNELSGVYWTMAELEKRIGKKHEWIKQHILYPQSFKKELDVMQGGFVYYPAQNGEKWSFQAVKMAKFLDDNFYKIFNP